MKRCHVSWKTPFMCVRTVSSLMVGNWIFPASTTSRVRSNDWRMLCQGVKRHTDWHRKRCTWPTKRNDCFNGRLWQIRADFRQRSLLCSCSATSSVKNVKHCCLNNAMASFFRAHLSRAGSPPHSTSDDLVKQLCSGLGTPIRFLAFPDPWVEIGYRSVDCVDRYLATGLNGFVIKIVWPPNCVIVDPLLQNPPKIFDHVEVRGDSGPVHCFW